MTLKERMAAGGCRACPSLRSSRSKVFCDMHLEQASRWRAEKAAQAKGTGKWARLSANARESMRIMRARGATYSKIAETFGYTIRTVHRVVNGEKKA